MSETHFFMEVPREVTAALPETTISRLFVEVCSDGFVTRELGLDPSDRLVHRAPTASTPYCLSGSRPIQYATVDDPAIRDVFDRLWRQESEGESG